MAQKLVDLLVTVTKEEGEQMTYTLIHPGVYETKNRWKYTPCLRGLGYKVRVAEVFYKYIIAHKNYNKRSGDYVTSRVPRSDGNSDDPRPVLGFYQFTTPPSALPYNKNIYRESDGTTAPQLWRSSPSTGFYPFFTSSALSYIRNIHTYLYGGVPFPLVVQKREERPSTKSLPLCFGLPFALVFWNKENNNKIRKCNKRV